RTTSRPLEYLRGADVSRPAGRGELPAAAVRPQILAAADRPAARGAVCRPERAGGLLPAALGLRQLLPPPRRRARLRRRPATGTDGTAAPRAEHGADRQVGALPG